jgi:hypothetical protein
MAVEDVGRCAEATQPLEGGATSERTMFGSPLVGGQMKIGRSAGSRARFDVEVALPVNGRAAGVVESRHAGGAMRDQGAGRKIKDRPFSTAGS